MDEQEYLTCDEAAAALGVHRTRMYALYRTGRYGQKVDGYIVFTKAEVAAYDQERTKRPNGGRPDFHNRAKKTKWTSGAVTP